MNHDNVIPFTSPESPHEHAWALPLLREWVYFTFSRILYPPKGDPLTKRLPLIDGFPMTLLETEGKGRETVAASNQWAQWMFEELSLDTPSASWQELLPPTAREWLLTHPEELEPGPDGFPRIIAQAGRQKVNVKRRWRSCTRYHRFSGYTGFVFKEEGKPKQELVQTTPQEWLQIAVWGKKQGPDRDKWAFGPKQLSNFDVSLLADLLRRKLHLRRRPCAALVCPTCNRESIHWNSNALGDLACPRCGSASRFGRTRITPVPDYLIIEKIDPGLDLELIPQYRPARVLPCRCGNAFPYPKNFDNEHNEPDRNQACTACNEVFQSKNNTSLKLWFWDPLNREAVREPGKTEPVSSSAGESDDALWSDTLEELSREGVPPWAIFVTDALLMAKEMGCLENLGRPDPEKLFDARAIWDWKLLRIIAGERDREQRKALILGTDAQFTTQPKLSTEDEMAKEWVSRCSEIGQIVLEFLS